MSAKSKKSRNSQPAVIEPLIREIRGRKVILDADLARVYGVTTKRLNEQVKRNYERFPEDFMFRLTLEEADTVNSRSQFGTLKEDSNMMRSQSATASKRNVRYLPFVFTEHGAIMAATILNSPQAVQMSVLVVRAFVRMKKMMLSPDDLAQEVAALKKELRGRLDVQESVIKDILQRIMLILDPPQVPMAPESSKRPIGFHVRD